MARKCGKHEHASLFSWKVEKDERKNYEDVDSWKTVMFLYNAALKEVGTKLEILNDEFQHVHRYNPIEHIKRESRRRKALLRN